MHGLHSIWNRKESSVQNKVERFPSRDPDSRMRRTGKGGQISSWQISSSIASAASWFTQPKLTPGPPINVRYHYVPFL